MAVGRVVGCHGLRGELVVEPWTDDLDRFDDFTEVFAGDEPEPRAIEGWRPHKGRVLLSLAGCEDRNAAESFRGVELTVPASFLRELEAGRFYIHDLVGLEVVEPGDRRIGKVAAYDEATSGGSLVIDLDSGRELSVPFVERWIDEVDLEARRVRLASGWGELVDPDER